ncbi:NAD-dependent epimerase/dehydratase family protein [Gammaproteobacteria bacterium]|nr:NAD-dependent epimerase/dehydratase family protein [Gammaproteobacteria bacterium]
MPSHIRILIAGSGYVGTKLAKLLQENGHTVYHLSRTEKHVPGCHHISADLLHLNPEILPDVQYIFYMASPDHRSETAYEHAYIHGLQNLLQAYDHRPIARLIFASSSVVYAENSGQWINETAPTTQEGFRSNILSQAEGIALAHSQSPIVARISGIYGPGRHRLLHQVLNQERFPENHTVYSNRIHVMDLCRALEHLMRIKHNESIYNVTDPTPTSINAILSWLAAKTGTPFPEASLSQLSDSHHLKNRRISSERIIRTGFTHHYPSFQEGFNAILKTLNQKRHPDY